MEKDAKLKGNKWRFYIQWVHSADKFRILHSYWLISFKMLKKWVINKFKEFFLTPIVTQILYNIYLYLMSISKFIILIILR